MVTISKLVRAQAGNVKQLNSYRFPHLIERQRIVRERLLLIANREAAEAPAAVVGIVILPDGHLLSTALAVEPEQIVPVLGALRKLIFRLEQHLTDSLVMRMLIVSMVVATIWMADSTLAPAIAACLPLGASELGFVARSQPARLTSGLYFCHFV